MKIFIPELGTILTLAEDWTFKVVNENRNTSLAKLQGVKGDYYYPWGTREVPADDLLDDRYNYSPGPRRRPVDPGNYTIAAGTSLEVDRIYIRKGAADFSSVTFKGRVGGKLIRFFAKLDDVNRMEI